VEVTEQHMRWVKITAQKFQRRYTRVDPHAIESAAVDGLLKGLASFDVDLCNGHPIKYWVIKGMEMEIKGVLRSGWWSHGKRDEQRQWVQPVTLPDGYDKACPDTVQSDLEMRSLAQRVVKEIHKLPKRERYVIREMSKGRPAKTLHGEMRVSYQTVYNLRDSALKTLREALVGEGFEL